MTHPHTRKTRWATARDARIAHREARDARKALAAQLAVYSSPGDLLEISAILDRHDDRGEADSIRRMIRWNAAA